MPRIDAPLIPVIVGPTAVGKTGMVVEWAKLLPLEVISADSRQVYKRLSIGTAKPTQSELSAAPHHLIDHVEPGRPYSAGRFHDEALAAIEAIRPDKQPVIVGGTGLYIRAIAEGFFEEPPLDPSERQRLRDWLNRQGNLQHWAARLDSGYQRGGTHRTMRAIEVSLLTGRPLSWWQEYSQTAAAITPWYIRLTMDRQALVARIEQRVDAMLKAGLIGETEALITDGVKPDSAGFNAVGYREVIRHLEGAISRDQMRSEIIISTRQYAKRQETWFRNQLPANEVLVFDARDGASNIAAQIAEKWNERVQS